MEKDFVGDNIEQHGPFTSHKPTKPDETKAAVKRAHVVQDMDEVIRAFDAMDEEGPVEFLLQNQTEAIKLPPLPTDREIQQDLIKNALLLVDGGEFALARNVLGDVLRRDNNCVEAIRWMGWCFRQEEDFENAVKCYEQLIQLRVTDQDLYELGEIYYAMKRDKDAEEVWLDALGQCDAESPRLFDLHKNLGNVFTRQGDYESAEENYNKALVLRPVSDVIQVNLGTLYFQRQNYKESLEHFKKAVEINPYNDRGWCGVALVAREMKDDDWARGVLLKALDLNPYNLTALQVLTHWAQQDNLWDMAINRIHVYVERNQDDADMIFALAGLLYQKGAFDEAEVELTRLEALDPMRPEIDELRKLIKTRPVL